MLDRPLSRKEQADDVARAPAAAPATATIIPDARAGGEDRPESPPPPDRPEVNPGPPPETNPDLQPEIPPVETPSIHRA